MPRRDLPTGFEAGKRFKLEGATYNVGDEIPNEVVSRIRKLSALLSNGMIRVNDVYRRRVSTKARGHNHTPAGYTPTERRSFPT